MSKVNRLNWTFREDKDNVYVYGTEYSCNQFIQAADDDYQLTDEENEALSKAFNLLDVDGDGVIELPELEYLLVSLGRLPFDDNLVKILSYSGAIGTENATGMSCKGFRKYVTHQLCNTTNEAELREAFRIFDTNPPTEKINVKELRHALKSMGSTLTDDELDFLYREQDYWMLDEKDVISYELLIDKLMGRPCNCKFLNS